MEQYDGRISPPARPALIILQKDGRTIGSLLTRHFYCPTVKGKDGWKGAREKEEEKWETQREKRGRERESESDPLLP